MAIAWDADDNAWGPSAPYAIGDRSINGGNVYGCTAAGTSATSGGPSGTDSAPITDGTVTWLYLGPFTGAVTAVAPQLDAPGKAIAPSAQLVFLNLAEQLVSDPDVWGTLLDDGRRYLAAHLAELSQLRGHGPVTASSVGPLSRSYASFIGPQAWMLTVSGRAYMDLVRTTTAVLGLVI